MSKTISDDAYYRLRSAVSLDTATDGWDERALALLTAAEGLLETVR